MIIKELIKIIEEWAPPGIAWEKDNIGLQIGSPEKPVQKILISLDVSDEVVDEAIKKNTNLIITHHPLIFEPLKSITTSDAGGKIIYKLIENGISLISMHTNLDFIRSGVSFSLAQKLELTDLKILKRSNDVFKKITVFVPSDYLEKITESMATAGAGIIGNYDYCSYRSSGVGTFRSSKNSKPFIGNPGEFEKVEEVRLEMIAPSWKVDDIINSMKKSHPYEEPAYDIYPIHNDSSLYGAGAIGSYENAMTAKKFIQHVKDKLGTTSLRYVEGNSDKIKTVAVCGGAGGNLLNRAINSKADAYLTGDISYHVFHTARSRILLIDAGHYETEIPVIENMNEYLSNTLAQLKENIQIITTTQNQNYIKYI